MSQQLHCCDMCKISLWLVEYILNQSTVNFGRISNSPWDGRLVEVHDVLAWYMVCESFPLDSYFTRTMYNWPGDVHMFMSLLICNTSHDLTHWGRVTHICVSNLIIFSSDDGLSAGRHLAIFWTNDGIFLIEPLGTNFNGFLIKILTFSFKKMHLKMSAAKLSPFCLGLYLLSTLCVLCFGMLWLDSNWS